MARPSEIEVAGIAGISTGVTSVLEGERQRVLVQAEQEVRAGLRRRCCSSSMSAGVDADRKALALQRAHGLAQQRERRFRQAAEVDDVRAGGGQCSRAAPAARRATGPAHRRSRRRCACRGAKGPAAGRPGRERPAGRRSRRGRARRERRNARTARRRSPRKRPGRMTRSAPSGSFSRRLMISSVISAATLTPMSIDLPRRTPSRRGRPAAAPAAPWRDGPVTKTSRSGMAARFGAAEFSLALADRRPQVGQRLDHLRPLESSSASRCSRGRSCADRP